MAFVDIIAAIGTAAGEAGAALGIGGEAAGAGAGAGVLGAGSGAAGGAGFGGLASGGGLLSQVGEGLGALQAVKGMSNNNPNSGMVAGAEPMPVVPDSGMFQQVMQLAQQHQQPKSNPHSPLQLGNVSLPWSNMNNSIIKKREAEDNTSMQLGQLLGMLAQGQVGLPKLHSVEDSGGSGAGGASGGLVKGILSKL
jgi:hypothetical protein